MLHLTWEKQLNKANKTNDSVRSGSKLQKVPSTRDGFCR